MSNQSETSLWKKVYDFFVEPRSFSPTDQALREIATKVQAAQLTYKSIGEIPKDIFFSRNLPLYKLVNLPTNALSGPVQEDKAAAHPYLKGLIHCEQGTVESQDLRTIYGIHCTPFITEHTSSLELLSTQFPCKQFGIISYKDFHQVLATALPQLASRAPMSLIQASWLNDQLFWEAPTTEAACAFSCAANYARIRGLTIQLPAEIKRYSLSTSGINNLAKNYHTLVMPEGTWTDSHFMSILLSGKLPYARYTIMKAPEAIEVLLLPRNNLMSHALGNELLKQGANEFTEYLYELQEDDFEKIIAES